MHSVYDQPDAASVHAQFDRVLEGLYGKLPMVATHLEAAREEILAFTVFPKEIWRRIWSNAREKLGHAAEAGQLAALTARTFSTSPSPTTPNGPRAS